MTTMRRVYLPLTEQQLTALRQTRELADPWSAGFAVTDAVRAEQAGTDDDELCEFAVTQAAARAALQADGVVVAAADIASSGVTEETGDGAASGAVRVSGPLPLKRFASFHLVDRGAAEDDPEAEVELSWFDATELDLLLDVIGNS